MVRDPGAPSKVEQSSEGERGEAGGGDWEEEEQRCRLL
jgi:hypothetical protein